MKKKSRNPRKKTSYRQRFKGLVLKPTASGFEWQKPEGEDKDPSDEMFSRVLARFGWMRNESGYLEHGGAESESSR